MNSDFMWSFGWLGQNADLIVSALIAVACFAMVLFGSEVTSEENRFFLFLPLGIASIGGFIFCYSVNTEHYLMYNIGTSTLVAGFALAMLYALVWFIKNTIKLFKTPKAV